jgi:5-methyltetrahydropteroyltriglutamate--homocysteine methyltransferase
VIGKLDFPDDHPELTHAFRLSSVTPRMSPRRLIPSPAVPHFCGGRRIQQAYPDLDAFAVDLEKTYRKATKAFYDAERYLQLRDTNWGLFCS